MYEYNAKCTRVVDGDTIDCEVDLTSRILKDKHDGVGSSPEIDLGFSMYANLSQYTKQRFRLYGIDAPETYGVKHDSEEYAEGMKAKNRLIELIEGKWITIKTIKDKKGKYGRYLCTIICRTIHDESVSIIDPVAIMLKEGLVEKKEY